MSEINCKFALVEQKRRYFYTGFMCHQVIEKTLKAYWCVCLDVDKVSLALLRSLKEREAEAFCCPRLVLRLIIYRFRKSGFAWWKVLLCLVESPALLGGKSCFKGLRVLLYFL